MRSPPTLCFAPAFRCVRAFPFAWVPSFASAFSFVSVLGLLGCSTEGGAAPSYTDDIDSLQDDPTQRPDDDESSPSHGLPDVPPPIVECAEDSCPLEGGVTWRCRSRFVYGANLAWDSFGADFGGIEAWGAQGISREPIKYSNILADMKAHGVNVVRWWMIPDFRGDAVAFDEEGNITGVGGTLLDDVTMALELAQIHDVYLMLTLFSFDGFRPQENFPHLTPIVLDVERREQLVENVVRPIARHVEQSEHKIRMHSWDLINEPEWAMIGPSLYGDPPFLESDTGTEPISHGEMEQFLAEMNTVLRQESSALISVGTTMKWPLAWGGLDVDFHQLHYYPWLEPSFPLDVTPEELGLIDLPVVLGEFPLAEEFTSESVHTYEETLALLRENGWAGALGWDFSNATASNKDQLQAFAEENACQTAY